MLKNYLSQALKLTKKDQNIKSTKIITLFKFLYPYLKAYKKKFVATGFLMLLLSLISMPGPYLTKYLIDDIFPNKLYSQLHLIIILLVFLALIRIAISFFMDYILTIINQKVVNKMRSDLFNKIIKLPLTIINKTQTGYLFSRLNEVQQLQVLFSAQILQFIVSIFEFCFSIAILFTLSWELTLVSFITLPLFYFVTRWFTTGLKKTSKDLMEKTALLAKDFQDSLAGIETIKAFTSENKQIKKIDKQQKVVLQSSMIQRVFMKISGEAVGFVASTSGLLILWVSGIMIMNDSFTIGMYFAFSGYLGKVYAPTNGLATLNLIFQPAVVALSRVKEFFDTVSEDEDVNRTIAFNAIQKKIVFKNVCFSYEKDKSVINSINCEIKKGKKTAFVGASGAGKSSIIKLILGYYKSESGSIEIDGNNIDQIILKELRDKIGIVNQNIYLFNDTFKNNILISKPDATEAELILAAKSSGIHDLISQLPDGYDSMISERGNNLSGGQIQRIAIARLILRNPEILIFDEATSQLDGESEKIINSALDKIFSSKTRIIISHRLSNIHNCDYIYVIDNGKIVQEGEHNSLIFDEGAYKNIFS